MKRFTLLILVLTLIACGGSDAPPPSSQESSRQSSPPPQQTFDSDSPEGVVSAYSTACITGDTATALSLAIPEIRALLAGSSPCETVDEDVTYDAYLDTRTVGETTFVTWLWEWDEPQKTIHYEFALTNVDGEGWRIFEGDTIYHSRIDVRTETVDSESTIQQDPNLPSEISYTLQEGTPVEQITRIQIVSGKGIERTETVMSEELATPTQSGLEVVGTGSMPDLMAQAKSFAIDYFASYQANDWATITSLTYPDDIDNYNIANANALAGTRIIDIDVDEVSSVNYVYLDRIATYSGRGLHMPQTLRKPVAVVYEMPTFIRFEVFGKVAIWEDTIIVLYTPDGWKMRYWGITKVTEPETVTKDDHEFTINGIAVMPDQILLVFTTENPLYDYKFKTLDELDNKRGRFYDAEIADNGLGLYVGPDIHPNANSLVVEYWVSPSLGTRTRYRGEVVLPLQ